MLDAIGPTLVCTAITGRESFARQLLDAVHIDRLNIGPVPTTRLNWLQPHEGNIVEFLFRARAFQTAPIGAGSGSTETTVGGDTASRTEALSHRAPL